jgi:uncharacterized protein
MTNSNNAFGKNQQNDRDQNDKAAGKNMDRYNENDQVTSNTPANQQFENSGNQAQQGGTTHRGGSGNFAENPQRAAEAGRKGGQNSHGGQKNYEEASYEESAQNKGSGNSGNFANDPQRASEASKHSHDQDIKSTSKGY